MDARTGLPPSERPRWSLGALQRGARPPRPPWPSGCHRGGTADRIGCGQRQLV